MCENGQGILKRASWQKGSMFEEVYFIPAKEAAAESPSKAGINLQRGSFT
jgi:hypothetical protein